METKHTFNVDKINKELSRVYGIYNTNVVNTVLKEASAPDLLEALIRVKQYLIENSDILAPFPTRSELDNINAAINKATK